jgi:methyl-accepting chemotaxis protein
LAADSLFNKSFIIAKSNITESGEDTLINGIDSFYKAYREHWTMLMNTDSNKYDVENYYADFHSGFILTKMKVNKLLSINEKSMFEEAEMLKDKAKRALMPGLVAIITALIFMLIFNFLISHYFVNPLKNLIRSVKHYIPSSKKEFSAGVDSEDEIKELEQEIAELVKRIKSRRKDEI